MAIDLTGTDNSLNKITSEKEVRLNPNVELNNNTIQTTDKSAAGTKLEKDGANLNNSKGKIPASGFSLGASDSPGFVTNAEQVIQSHSGDKQNLQAMATALEHLDLSKGFESLSDDDLAALVMLGFDISSNHGHICIQDNSGNNIKLDDFANMQMNLKNTLKRSIASVDNGTAPKSPPGFAGINNAAGMVAQAVTSSPLYQSVDPIIQEIAQNVKMFIVQTAEAEKRIAPLKAEIQKNIQEYEAMVQKIEQQADKVDKSIDQINVLKTQAEAIVEKSKTTPISDLEKKQLQSLVTTIQQKQTILIKDHESSELLMKQLNQAFGQFEPNLSETEKGTMSSMKSAIEARVSGQSLTVRQNFLATISEDVYKLTSGMNDDELQNILNDSNQRVKFFSPINKVLDKALSAGNLEDLSSQDMSLLWDKLKIKAVTENGKLELYYFGADAKNPMKVEKEELKTLKTDLNNIVSSPELFNLARAVGQISLAYDKTPVELPADNNPQIKSTKKEDVSAPVVAPPDNKEKSSSAKSDDSTGKEIDKKIDGFNDKNYMDKNMEEKRRAEKYHLQKIDEIHGARRETNRFLEKKRIQEVEIKRSQENI